MLRSYFLLQPVSSLSIVCLVSPFIFPEVRKRPLSCVSLKFIQPVLVLSHPFEIHRGLSRTIASAEACTAECGRGCWCSFRDGVGTGLLYLRAALSFVVDSSRGDYRALGTG